MRPKSQSNTGYQNHAKISLEVKSERFLDHCNAIIKITVYVNTGTLDNSCLCATYTKNRFALEPIFYTYQCISLFQEHNVKLLKDVYFIENC